MSAQLFSSSVADALQFLREDCNDPIQKDNQATVTFVRKIDHLFDLLNSHSPFACCLKLLYAATTCVIGLNA